MKALPFTGSSEEETRWDEFIARCHNANFLHSRKFLAYHGNRFADCSVWLENDKRRLVGVFPAAVSPADSAVVCSHPGATYGGIAHTGGCGGDDGYEALTALCEYYRAAGFHRLIYKTVPHIYHAHPSEDDLSALFRSGAKLIRRDLHVAVPPGGGRQLSERRRRGLKKSATVQIVQGGADMPHAAALWRVIEQNVADRYRMPLTHRWDEIQQLAAQFPQEIVFIAGIFDNVVEGGVIIFRYPTVQHTQYIGTSDTGRRHCLLDAVFHYLLKEAQTAGCWFSFGNTSEDDGQRLNTGLYRFKQEFGGGGVAHDFYEIALVL